MDRNNPLQNNFNNTGFNNYTQNNFSSSDTNYTQPPTIEQQSDPGYFFATGDNRTPAASYTIGNYEQRSEQSVFSFMNNETQSLPYVPQQHTNQNLSLPLNTTTGSSQANNSESVFNFEIPGFNIKIIVTPTSFPIANLTSSH